MDKKTLSSYGWIIIVTLILAVMIAFSTPFGEYVGKSATAMANSFIDANEETLSDENLNSLGNKWDQKFRKGIHGAVPTVYELQKNYKFTYYNSFKDISDNNITQDKENATVGTYIDEKGIKNIVLLETTEITNMLDFSEKTVLNLGGKTLKINSNDGMRRGIQISSSELVTIDGRLEGSSIECYEDDDGVKNVAFIMVWNDAKAKLVNVEINVKTEMNGKPAWALYTQPGAELTVDNCNINIETTEDNVYGIRSDGDVLILKNSEININVGQLSEENEHYIEGVIAKASAEISNVNISIISKNEQISRGISIGGANNETVKITNCNINLDTNGDTRQGIVTYSSGNANSIIENCTITTNGNINDAYGIASYGTGEMTIKNCEIMAYSNYDGNSYENSSVGVRLSTNAITTLINCHVYGTHSGLQNEGNLYISGGIYEGYGHGGIYFTGVNTTSYVEDAIIRESKMLGGYTATHNTNHAGMYIGGSMGKDGIKVYMDNCDIWGSMQPIVLRGTSGEQNNTLYISNSKINLDQKIRIDNDTHKLYCGIGNNFTIDNVKTIDGVDMSTVVIETNEVYRKK